MRAAPAARSNFAHEPDPGSSVTARGKRWISAAVLTAVIGPFAAHAQSQPAPSSTSGPTAFAATQPTTAPTAMDTGPLNAETLAADDVARLRKLLLDPATPAFIRDDAARRLLSRAGTEGLTVLADALKEFGIPAAQISAARALGEAPAPAADLVDPLFATIDERSSRSLTDAAAHALARYDSRGNATGRMLGIVRAAKLEDAKLASLLRSMGASSDKRVAQELVQLLADRGRSIVIRAAAADGLVAMTGITDYGQDALQWQSWWNLQVTRSDAEFAQDMVKRKAVAFDVIRERRAVDINDLELALGEAYRLVPDAERDALLLGWLRSQDPDIRVVGARRVIDDFSNNRTIAATTRAELRNLLGDSNAAVRAAAAVAIQRVNDPAALAPLLAQLVQEPDPAVRVSLTAALEPVSDLRSVPTLIKLLDDRSLDVARTACVTLRSLGPKLLATDPQLASRLATKLLEVIKDRGATPEGQPLREAAVGALIHLKQGDVLKQLSLGGLLDARKEKSALVRINMLRALGELADTKNTGQITPSLNDPEPAVRLEAVRALGPGAVEEAATLWQRLDPQQETDPDVRKEVWQVLTSILPQLPVEQLQQRSEQMRDDKEKQVLILLALRDKYVAIGDAAQLATTQYAIAEGYLALNQPADAAKFFRASLDFKDRQSTPPIVIEKLVAGLFDSLVRARSYDEAMTFATDRLKPDKNPGIQGDIIASIRTESEKLLKADDLANARSLLMSTQKLVVPNPQDLTDKLRDSRQQLSDKLKQNGQPGLDAAGPATRP